MVKQLKGWQSKVVGEIHDSMLIDAHPDEISDIILMAQQICTVDLPNHWSWIDIPMRIEVAASEIDGNWAEMKGAA
jgi:hypothetical protein